VTAVKLVNAQVATPASYTEQQQHPYLLFLRTAGGVAQWSECWYRQEKLPVSCARLVVGNSSDISQTTRLTQPSIP